ncbi:hypothetical protein [Amycolatopsis samaneae]|uniref:Uncharacterized protein n=1 Tax=Amycolatopsis samaneae TaxID=664691 RepID=A0ABW5GPU2_9PSEU
MDILTKLADQALRQPPPRGTGRYHYVHTQGWYLATAQTTSGRVLDSRIEPTDREFWVAEDGSGRIAETRDGRPSRMSGTYEPPGLLGEFVTGDSVDALQATLLRRNPTRSPQGWLKLTQELWTRQVVSPALHAAVLRILAAQPELSQDGPVTDRVGRPGVAVSAQSTPAERYVLTLDPGTGGFLGFEQIAPGPAGAGCTVWRDSGYVPDTTTRP